MQELAKDKLYSFDEKVRIELGPQIIELECNDENLGDDVTAPHYRIGGRDALGRVIRPDDAEKPADLAQFGAVGKGEKMACVDWRAKHVPHVWKVYQLQETAEMDKDGSPMSRFVKVDECGDKDAAVARANAIVGEIK